MFPSLEVVWIWRGCEGNKGQEPLEQVLPQGMERAPAAHSEQKEMLCGGGSDM